MPYLQLGANGPHAPEGKQQLAAAMCETYARLMSIDIRRITVAIREHGEDGLWRIPEVGSDPEPASVLMLDIRRGRPAQLRLEVAKALAALCVKFLGLSENCLNVEFTQHSGDEMYHPALGGWNSEWTPGER